MSDDWKGLLAFLGAITILVPWCCGVYQWARWGWAGQVAIASMRKDLDAAVKDSVRSALKESIEETTV